MAIVLFVVCAIALFWFLYILKIPKCGNMVLVTGGVKTGKTTLSMRLVYKTWKKQCLKVRIQNALGMFFKKIHFKKFENFEKKPLPLIYSNIPLGELEYVPLTQALIRREERFVYGSVVYVCESSLMADSMSYKDDYVNEQLLLLNKLIAHETHGGYLFYDTQSIGDNHYSIKRCLSSYFYIHHAVKIPFFILMYVRELKYNDDNSTVNSFNSDIEDGLKLVIVPKSTWKYFDCYCYSALTDDLPVNDKTVKAESLKATDIITFKKFKHLIGGKKNEV